MTKKRFRANTGDGSQKIENFQEYIRKRDDEAYRFLLQSTEGRWFLARLLKAEGIHAGSFTGNSSTFYNEGRRAVVIAIRDKILGLGKRELDLLHQAEDELYDAEHYLESEVETDGER